VGAKIFAPYGSIGTINLLKGGKPKKGKDEGVKLAPAGTILARHREMTDLQVSCPAREFGLIRGTEDMEGREALNLWYRSEKVNHDPVSRMHSRRIGRLNNYGVRPRHGFQYSRTLER